MVGSGRLVGTILILVGVGAWVLIAIFLAAQVVTRETTVTGALLGIVLAFLVLAAPLTGFGVYLIRRGQQEAAEFSRIQKERELLNMVLTQGKVSFSEAAITLNVSRDEVAALVRSLVGKNLFSGAINWKEGVLYSEEATKLLTDKRCPNCGGELEIAGKGVIQCPWCGAEVFVHRDVS